jgi:hypothetical protein
MREVLVALNKLVQDKVIPTYAIGGAIGATFHIRPTATEDIDVFVPVPVTAGLVSISHIYESLKAQGAVEDGAYLRLGVWPVQILTDADPLTREALERAIDVPFEGVSTRVFTAEHLCALALQTGRPKDYARVAMFFDQNALNRATLDDILTRYDLTKKLPNEYKQQPPPAR